MMRKQEKIVKGFELYLYTNFLKPEDYWRIRELLNKGNDVWLELNRSLLNRKRLFTTQGWIDQTKIVRAVCGYGRVIEKPPSVDLFLDPNSKVKVKIIVGDGNHRIALALIKHSLFQ